MQKDNTKDIVDNLTDYQLSRWIALFEAVNIIADRVEDKGGVFDAMQIKQPPVEHYVDAQTDIIYRSLTGKGLVESEHGR